MFNNRIEIRLLYKKETGFFPGKPEIPIPANNFNVHNIKLKNCNRSDILDYIEWLENKLLNTNE